MIDKSLFDILGWEENTTVDVIGLRLHHRPGCVGYDPGVCYCMQTPTADDMLAWLRERGWSVSTAHAATSGYSTVELYGEQTGRLRRFDFSAQTILETLEVAVRAVAGGAL